MFGAAGVPYELTEEGVKILNDAISLGHNGTLLPDKFPTVASVATATAEDMPQFLQQLVGNDIGIAKGVCDTGMQLIDTSKRVGECVSAISDLTSTVWFTTIVAAAALGGVIYLYKKVKKLEDALE